MNGYGQYCPMALACEIITQRWTPLVLRELMLGRSRFNEIQTALPRMSPTLLAKRLKTLEEVGVIERLRIRPAVSGYRLTDAGAELVPVLETLGVWGKTWLPATLSQIDPDPDLIMWDLHRRIDLDQMPGTHTVVCFTFTDQPGPKRRRWIKGDRAGVELCIRDPGCDVDLFVETDSRTITGVWYGDLPLKQAISEGALRLDGPNRLCAAFPSWFRLNELASVPRKSPLGARNRLRVSGASSS
jgi:DNA-binding HxlR family transcriptional regulator